MSKIGLERLVRILRKHNEDESTFAQNETLIIGLYVKVKDMGYSPLYELLEPNQINSYDATELCYAVKFIRRYINRCYKKAK